jgi:hypothetical protein
MANLAEHMVTAASHAGAVQQWYSTACTALEKGCCLEVRFEDCTRIVEVHRVGISPHGAHILSGWQIRGPANERPGWKLLNLDEALELSVTDIASRAPRPDYRRGAKQFIGIICQL